MIGTIISLLSIAVLTGIDQLIKFYVENNLQPIGTAHFIDGFIGWSYVRNTGAAFGAFSDNTTMLSIVTGIVIAAGIALIVLGKIKNKFYLVCTVMIVSGGIGNLIDRVLKNYVVDYIEVQFMNFAVFNFADILITVGAFALMIYVIADMFRSKGKSGDN